jgi:cell wall-associated NlpC family hydrolase
MASMRLVSAARFALIAAFLVTATLITAPLAAAAETRTEYDAVYATAYAQLGDQWKHRATGPDKFDCSGLVFYAFRENGLKDRIGGYRSVAGYFRWFKKLGKVSRTHPRVGDLVVWGNNQHIGIYIGDGLAISTLVTRRGVAVHPVKGYLGIRLKAYLHTQITR